MWQPRGEKGASRRSSNAALVSNLVPKAPPISPVAIAKRKKPLAFKGSPPRQAPARHPPHTPTQRPERGKPTYPKPAPRRPTGPDIDPHGDTYPPPHPHPEEGGPGPDYDVISTGKPQPQPKPESEEERVERLIKTATWRCPLGNPSKVMRWDTAALFACHFGSAIAHLEYRRGLMVGRGGKPDQHMQALALRLENLRRQFEAAKWCLEQTPEYLKIVEGPHRIGRRKPREIPPIRG